MKGGKTHKSVGRTRLSQVDERNWPDSRFPKSMIQKEFEETFSFSASFPGQNLGLKLFKCYSAALTPQPSKTLQSGFFAKCTLLPDLLVYDNPSHKPLSVFMMTFCVLLIFQRRSVPLSQLSLCCSSPFVPWCTAPYERIFFFFLHFLHNIRHRDQTRLWVQPRR